MIVNDRAVSAGDGRVIYRQDVVTRITHWVWAIAMFFLLLSGLQIFNARPNLYIGQESGFQYENSILDIYALNRDGGPDGQTKIFGQDFDTTGVLGVSGSGGAADLCRLPRLGDDPVLPRPRHRPGGALLLRLDPRRHARPCGWSTRCHGPSVARHHPQAARPPRACRKDIWDHIRLRFTHGKSYTPLQKLAYFGVFVVAVPADHPGPASPCPRGWTRPGRGCSTSSAAGRRRGPSTSSRCWRFVLFFIVHIVMVVLAGPFNELRSMITGYYRTNVKPR